AIRQRSGLRGGGGGRDHRRRRQDQRRDETKSVDRGLGIRSGRGGGDGRVVWWSPYSVRPPSRIGNSSADTQPRIRPRGWQRTTLDEEFRGGPFPFDSG